MRITCDNPHHDAGEGICTFCVQALIDKAVKDERQNCIDAVLSVWTPISEDGKRWKDCQRAIQRKIRAADEKGW